MCRAALKARPTHRLRVYQLLCHVLKQLSNIDCTDIELRCSCHSLRNVMEVAQWLTIDGDWGLISYDTSNEIPIRVSDSGGFWCYRLHRSDWEEHCTFLVRAVVRIVSVSYIRTLLRVSKTHEHFLLTLTLIIKLLLRHFFLKNAFWVSCGLRFFVKMMIFSNRR